jgi:Cytochrome P450
MTLPYLCMFPLSFNFGKASPSRRVAGSETTSASTTAFLLLLLNNPNKLERLVEEIDSTFPSADDDITFAKLKELPYLNAVVWEGLRLMAVPAGTQTDKKLGFDSC